MQSPTDSPLVIATDAWISNGESVADSQFLQRIYPLLIWQQRINPLQKNQQRQICIGFLPLLIPLLNCFSNGF